MYHIMDKLPKALSDKLRVYGWKEYAGDNPLHTGFWAKTDKAIRITPARKMTRMYHVTLILGQREDSRFINSDELEKLIEN
jgi:hypothetical protein